MLEAIEAEMEWIILGTLENHPRKWWPHSGHVNKAPHLGIIAGYDPPSEASPGDGERRVDTLRRSVDLDDERTVVPLGRIWKHIANTPFSAV